MLFTYLKSFHCFCVYDKNKQKKTFFKTKTKQETKLKALIEGCDRKLTARFFTLVMAFQRFANLTEDDIDVFQENAINKNTKTSTKFWMSVVKLRKEFFFCFWVVWVYD